MWAHDLRSAQDMSTSHNLCSPGRQSAQNDKEDINDQVHRLNKITYRFGKSRLCFSGLWNQMSAAQLAGNDNNGDEADRGGCAGDDGRGGQRWNRAGVLLLNMEWLNRWYITQVNYEEFVTVMMSHKWASREVSRLTFRSRLIGQLTANCEDNAFCELIAPTSPLVHDLG